MLMIITYHTYIVLYVQPARQASQHARNATPCAHACADADVPTAHARTRLSCMVQL
jgi:hypothetical protein